MKRITYLTCSLIVACGVTAMNPLGMRQTRKRFLIHGTAGPAEKWNNSPVTEAV
ncbi:MAG: hypothetical protein WCX22_07665 [Methanoregula sp.]